MGLLKEGKVGLLKIQKALAAAGYYAFSADMMTGYPIETIHVREYVEEHDAQLIRHDEEVLALLPDDANYAAWQKAYMEWKP
jgi:hypothetical protein